jgi:hypothetical protein
MTRALLGLFLLCSTAMADDIPTFPESKIFEISAINEHRFNLALGGMEKKNGEWQNEFSQRIHANGQRITIEVGRNLAVNEVFAFYQDYYKGKMLKQLFRCESLDCGSSAQWANGYFGVRELYGIDTSQRLAVWLLNGEEGQSVVTLYVVQRGNKRVYAHIDHFSLDHPMFADNTPVSVLLDVFNTPSLTIDELRDIAEQIRTAQQQGHIIVLVGHSYASSKLDEAENFALDLAGALADKLNALGVDNLQVNSAGLLAPQGEAALERVSVISLKP